MCSAELTRQPAHKSSCSLNGQLSQVHYSYNKLFLETSDRKETFFLKVALFIAKPKNALYFYTKACHSTFFSPARSVLKWIKFLYLLYSVVWLSSTKLNIHSGCPPRNLTSYSKDFRESIRKLQGTIFLYFGTLLTCSRYLFSF